MAKKILKELLENKWIKFIGGLMLFVAVSCGIAWMINHLILQPSDLKFIDAENKTGALWLGFWATFLSSIASFAMVLITWWTLRQTQQQWENEQRAKLNFTLDIAQKIYVLKIRNVGREDAYKIEVKFNKEFLDCITAKSIKEIYTNLQKTPFCIESGQTRYIYISSMNSDKPSTHTIGDETFTNKDIKEWLEINKNQEIIITGSYCDKYQINETLKLSDIMIDGALRIRDDLTVALESINKGVVSPNNISPLYTIQKSLDIIAKKIDNVLPKEGTE